MGGVKEIKIDSTLWTTHARLDNLIDFKPEKISIETKTNVINNMKVHNIKYENGGFYLTINNLRGYLMTLINKINIIKYGKIIFGLLIEDKVN